MPKPLTRNPDGSSHEHVYIRRSKNSYKCAHPECSHWLPKNELKGKQSVCAICFKNPVMLDWKQLQLARPHCIGCGNTKESKVHREAIERFREMGIV